MTNDRSKEVSKIDLAKMKRWFGPPPLLGGEKPKDFANYVRMLAECMEPDDQVIATLVYQYAIESYTHMRLMRYQAQAIGRRTKTRIGFDTKHAHNKRTRETEKWFNTELVEDIKDENDANFTSEVLEETPFDSVNKAIAHAEEIDWVIAFEGAIDLYEKIDALISQCAKRRNDALHQIEWYRASLAEKLRIKCEAACYAPYKEKEQASPALVPTEDGK